MPQECKLIIFDLDGVLLDAKMIHYEALNMALSDVDPKFAIKFEDHVGKFDGLPTLKKLELMEFPTELVSQVSNDKQVYTLNLIRKNVEFNPELQQMIIMLKKHYNIAVASNSIKKTLVLALDRLGISPYIDFIIGNQGVINPKPNPEMFLRCMIRFSVAPNETLIVEDSEVGRKAAIASGATLCPVNDMHKDVTYERIKRYAEGISDKQNMWKDDNLNIVIPMAGEGSRFAQAGFTFPKPLIEVEGQPMIQLIVKNLNIDANYIFLAKFDHFEKYCLDYLLPLVAGEATNIVTVPKTTDGAARTVLLASPYIDCDKPLLIANSDQYIEWDSSNFMYKMTTDNLDAGIVTFTATHPKWSFVRVEDGVIIEVAEKKPISDIATVGIYYWRRGSDFVKYAKRMITKNIRVNGEFYVAPVFNEAIADGKIVKPYHVEKMWGLGTPEDLNAYLNRS